jgi:hypothetical protein
MIDEHQLKTGDDTIRKRTHQHSFADVIRGDEDAQVAFFIRDPVRRFVSGFNSRLRKGMPRHNSGWSANEEAAFKRFPSASELGEALSSGDPELRAAAEAAMHAISHARRGLAHHLESAEFLESNRRHIVFIGEQETFDQDIRAFRTIAGIASDISPPQDDVGAHRTPREMPTALSPLAEANLRAWYADDYEVYHWCRANRQPVG